MDSPPIPASLPTRALRRSGSGLRTPRPHLHALTSGIALIIATVLGPLLLFVLGLWDRFMILIRKLKTKQQPTMNDFGPTLHPARKRAEPASSTPARIPGEPLISSRSFQRLKHRVIAFIGPQRASLIHQGLITSAALLFLGCLSWWSWDFVKINIGVYPVADPVEHRQVAAELVQMAKDRQEIQKAVYLRWVRESQQDGKLSRALEYFRRINADLRSRHQINSKVEILVGDMTYQELLESCQEHDRIVKKGEWDQYVNDVVPTMEKAFGTIPR